MQQIYDISTEKINRDLIEYDYKLVKLPTDSDVIDSFLSFQRYASSTESIFISTNTGVLIRQDFKIRVFSMVDNLTNGFSEDALYDLDYFNENLAKNIETNDVMYCGVYASTFDGCKLMVHAPDSKRFSRLILRGLDIALENNTDINSDNTATLLSDQFYEGYIASIDSNTEEYLDEIIKIHDLFNIKAKIKSTDVKRKDLISI